MQVKVEDVSPVEKRIAVEIEWPMVAAKLDEAYRKLGRGVAIKGFRKGHVPRNMLEKMYAQQIEQEVTQQLVNDTFGKAAVEHQLSPVVEPVVDNVHFHKGMPFHYSAKIEVRHEFEPADYLGLTVERGKPSVGDDEVEAALLRKREEVTEWKKIEGRPTLAASDVVFVDFEGTVGDQKAKREGAMIDLGGGRSEGIPGLAKALIGQPVDAKDLELSFTIPADPAADAAQAEVRDASGREAKLKLTIREAREKLVPALDDDFAKDTGEADTLDELRGKLKEQLLAGKEKEIDQEVRADVIREALRKNPFQVAPALVERQCEQMIRDAKMRMAMSGIDPRMIQLDEAKLKADLRDKAVDEVRALFLIDAIATKEKVEVSEADIEKRVGELAKEQNKVPQRFKAELQKEGRLDGIRYRLREEKTLDLLISRANITAK